MEPLQLTFQYNQQEYVKAERQYLIASKAISISNIVLVVLLVPVAVFFMFFSSFTILSIVTFALAMFAAVTGSYLYLFSPGQKFKFSGGLHEEYQLTFSEGGIIFKTPSAESEIKWDVYSEIWESGDFYFLIREPQVYALIPKRAFPDVSVLQAFQELVTSKLGAIRRIG